MNFRLKNQGFIIRKGDIVFFGIFDDSFLGWNNERGQIFFILPQYHSLGNVFALAKLLLDRDWFDIFAARRTMVSFALPVMRISP